MIGYKAFDQYLKCRGFQFEVGKTYTKDTPKEEMRCCTGNVFHFCREIYAIERVSTYKLSDCRICEVIAGDVVRDGDKFGTNQITILREIVGEEKNSIINSGYCNSGYRNSGDFNSGYCNSGYCNSGDFNSGDFNSGDRNSGYCNSITPPIRIFNRETDVARADIHFPDFFCLELTIFVSYDTATDEEREQHKKDIEICGGFLKTIQYKEAWRKSWDKASDADRRKVLELPNWDNAVFREISGIDVELELGIRKESNNE